MKKEGSKMERLISGFQIIFWLIVLIAVGIWGLVKTAFFWFLLLVLVVAALSALLVLILGQRLLSSGSALRQWLNNQKRGEQ